MNKDNDLELKLNRIKELKSEILRLNTELHKIVLVIDESQNSDKITIILNEAVELYSFYYGIDITIEDLKSKTRKRDFVICRQLCMYLLKLNLPISLKTIGHTFGNRDHSTVIHAKHCIDNILNQYGSSLEKKAVINVLNAMKHKGYNV
jgi:chromosomal replication initiator protein